MVPAQATALQAPPWHDCPSRHLSPQALQSVLVPSRRQTPPQLVEFNGQHLPIEQVGKAFAQQVAPHMVPAQATGMHDPLVHALPAGHMLPQAAQLALVPSGRQTPPQFT